MTRVVTGKVTLKYSSELNITTHSSVAVSNTHMCGNVMLFSLVFNYFCSVSCTTEDCFSFSPVLKCESVFNAVACGPVRGGVILQLKDYSNKEYIISLYGCY